MTDDARVRSDEMRPRVDEVPVETEQRLVRAEQRHLGLRLRLPGDRGRFCRRRQSTNSGDHHCCADQSQLRAPSRDHDLCIGDGVVILEWRRLVAGSGVV